MNFTAILKHGPVFHKWMKHGKQGGTLHGTEFTRVGSDRNATFVATDIKDMDTLKADAANVIIHMTGEPEPTTPDNFRPDALSQGILNAADVGDTVPAHVTNDPLHSAVDDAAHDKDRADKDHRHHEGKKDDRETFAHTDAHDRVHETESSESGYNVGHIPDFDVTHDDVHEDHGRPDGHADGDEDDGDEDSEKPKRKRGRPRKVV